MEIIQVSCSELPADPLPWFWHKVQRVTDWDKLCLLTWANSEWFFFQIYFCFVSLLEFVFTNHFSFLDSIKGNSLEWSLSICVLNEPQQIISLQVIQLFVSLSFLSIFFHFSPDLHIKYFKLTLSITFNYTSHGTDFFYLARKYLCVSFRWSSRLKRLIHLTYYLGRRIFDAVLQRNVSMI